MASLIRNWIGPCYCPGWRRFGAGLFIRFRGSMGAFGGACEGVEPSDAVAGGGGQVGADRAEDLGSVDGAHAAGDLDAQRAAPVKGIADGRQALAR